ncbi:MAG: STT3 domain-containing protein [Aquificaceae bacterium]
MKTKYLYLLLLLTLLFGIYLRYKDIPKWKEHEELFFYKGNPLYTEADSYYFTRFAEEIREGSFKQGQPDPLRFFPDNNIKTKPSQEEKPYTPYPYSMYSMYGIGPSCLFSWLQALTGKSIPQLAFYLIPILAVSPAIPLFLYFNRLNLPFVGLLGGLVAISSPLYVGRTYLGRLDHDIFNLTFPFLIAYLFYRFFESWREEPEGKKPYLWISLASLFLLLYYFWYGHANLNFVLLIAFLVVFFWELYEKRKKSQSKAFYKNIVILLSLLLIPQLWYVYTGPMLLYQQVSWLVFGIRPAISTEMLFKDFPNIFISIGELQRLPFNQVLLKITISKEFGLLGLTGAFLLFLFHIRSLFFLLPFFGIGLLAFFSGARFIMYLAPFIGMGLAYLVYVIFENILPRIGQYREEYKRRLAITLIGSLIFFGVLYGHMLINRGFYSPMIDAPIVKGMEWIRKNTPASSVIWSWWDYGYVFEYYSRRAVIHDGGSQSSPKTYLVAKSFSTSDPREGWLITSFVVNYGLRGLEKLMMDGLSAQEVVNKISTGSFAKPIEVPVYWVVTRDMLYKFWWIHFFGSYDFKKKEGTFGEVINPACAIKADNLFECYTPSKLIIDLNEYLVKTGNNSTKIKSVYLYDENSSKLSQVNKNSEGYTVFITKDKKGKTHIFLYKHPYDNSLLLNMYLLRKYDKKYFELVYDDFPHMVVYRVKPNID